MATTTTRHHRRRGTTRYKGALAAGALVASAALVIGTSAAFFSDAVSFSGSATVGTLDISGQLSVSHTDGITVDNFVTTGMSGNNTVDNLDPGDVLKVAGTITNEGGMSAWIRTAVSVSSVDTAIGQDLYVYAGEDVPTQAQLLAADTPAQLADLPGYVDTASGIAAGNSPATSDSAVKVVSGDPDDTAPQEDGTDSPSANTYNATVLVYFDRDSGNRDQDEQVALTVVVQALQYRNHTTVPTTAEWANVQQVSAGS